MNMNNHPSLEELRELIRACDDRAGHHTLWIDEDGEVRITQRPKDPWQVAPLPVAKIQFETFLAGNEYVGPDAAQDDAWMTQLFRSLIREWNNTKAEASLVPLDQVYADQA